MKCAANLELSVQQSTFVTGQVPTVLSLYDVEMTVAEAPPPALRRRNCRHSHEASSEGTRVTI